jgi:uncharacterized damage-inducible protein DinB
MHPRLTELREYADAQRSALLAITSTLPLERWTERPATGGWSIVELLEHLYKVEHGSSRAIARAVADARAAGHPRETDQHSVMGALDGVGLRDRSRRLEVPERVAPTGGWSPQEALDKLAASRAELHDAMTAGDGLALGSVYQTHARLGEIDVYRWILFIAQHEARHAQQAAEIVEQLGVPAG